MTDFDQWYYGEGDDRGYPRKEKRGDAKKAFAAALKVATLEELIEGRKRSAAHWEASATERKYIPLPASWLRAECWTDEYEHGQTMSQEQIEYWQARQRSGEWVPDTIADTLPRQGLKVIK